MRAIRRTDAKRRAGAALALAQLGAAAKDTAPELPAERGDPDEAREGR